MTYRLALLISFLCHSLAWAGTTWLWAAYGGPRCSSVIPSSFIAQVQWMNPGHKESQAPLPALPTKPPSLPQKNKMIAPAAPAMPLTLAQDISQTGSISSTNLATLTAHPDNKPPLYPEAARRQGLTGKIILKLAINPHGQVVGVTIEQGHETAEILKTAALAAIKTWRFIRADAQGGLLFVTLPIVFNLET